MKRHFPFLRAVALAGERRKMRVMSDQAEANPKISVANKQIAGLQGPAIRFLGEKAAQ